MIVLPEVIGNKMGQIGELRAGDDPHDKVVWMSSRTGQERAFAGGAGAVLGKVAIALSRRSANSRKAIWQNGERASGKGRIRVRGLHRLGIDDSAILNQQIDKD